MENAKQEPKIYVCKHITAGVCGYANETILIGEETLKDMNPTFAGKPIYVNHQEVNLETIQQDADGYVVKSFFLPEDGCNWAEIIIVSDAGHEAINRGYKVSNAYLPESFGAGGEWHNIPYNREVLKAHYTHLALVSNPRYEEAEIMTQEEFKLYKEEKKEQLNQLQNSKGKQSQKGDKSMEMFKFFKNKKEEISNSKDITKETLLELDGNQISIGDMISALEEKEKVNSVKEIESKSIKVNGKNMTIKELIEAYQNAVEEKEKKEAENEDDEEDKEEKKDKKGKKNKGDKKNKGEAEDDDEIDEEENEDDEDDDEEKNEDDDKKDKDGKEEKKDKKNAKEHFNKLNDAAKDFNNSKDKSGNVIDTAERRAARGA
ncbi:MAG: DUF2213 domain-containing protein, partial [Elusimicrobiota bacterium]|nr:DUF2213 domain-containing protein [Elusimicrobiota bacterium]